MASGPCLSRVNTGAVIFEAPSEEEAQSVLAEKPMTGAGYMRRDLRPYRLGLLRGRDLPPEVEQG